MKKNIEFSFILKIIAAGITIVISWFSIGIGFAEPLGNPLLSAILFLGGLALCFSAIGFIIYYSIRFAKKS